MSTSPIQRHFWLRYSLQMVIILLTIPPLIYIYTLLVNGFGIADSFQALINQYGQTRRNPLLMAILGIFPFLLQAIVIAVIRLRVRRKHGDLFATENLAWGGSAMIAIVLIWAYVEFWPNFLPGKQYPGFPHGLEVVIASLFFAPVGAAIGMIITYLLMKKR